MTYDNFGAAIGIPMALLLPVMAILSVTSEWSQRSGLTTFTLVPHRGRVIWAKMVVSIVARRRLDRRGALAIGALGNIVGSGYRRRRHGLGHLGQNQIATSSSPTC